MPSPFATKTCEWCGKTWETRKRSARTCSPLCRARLRETEKPTAGARPKEYPPELVARVREMYADGHTMAEVAELAGTTIKTLQRLMPRYGIARRGFGKRDQRGNKNASWRGSNATYGALHLRVEAARGKPRGCQRCGTTDPNIRYAWANLTGAYEDVNDYERMCPACHNPFDAARRRETGELTVPAGLRR